MAVPLFLRASLLLGALVSIGWTNSLEDEENAATCDLAVVGAGIGGAYAAYRSSAAGKSVCIFELNNRPGGRIHSLRKQGPKQDMVVEAGAYRFTAGPICEGGAQFCFDTPLVRALVQELGLPIGVYNPDPKAWDHKMRKIVDKDGNDAGYLTIPETLLDKATKAGAKVFYNTKVVGISGGDAGSLRAGSPVKVSLEDGKAALAKAVLLNIPQKPVLELLRNSGLPYSEIYPEPLYDPKSENLMKLYVYYEDAWWRNDLGLKTGHFQNNNPTWNGTLSQFPAPLSGQYHDADLRCDRADGKCRGFLQAYYASPGLEFYEPYHNLVSEAAVQLSPVKSVEHKHLLETIHKALVELHRKDLDSVNATKRVAEMRPTAGVLSIWRGSVEGINGGCHSPKDGQHPSPGSLPEAALQPFAGLPVYVANEAYGPLSCWAEGSMNMSYNVVQRLGVPQPEVEWIMPADAPYPKPSTDPFLLFAAKKRREDAESERSSVVNDKHKPAVETSKSLAWV